MSKLHITNYSRLFCEVAIEFGYINDEVLKKYVEAKAA